MFAVVTEGIGIDPGGSNLAATNGGERGGGENDLKGGPGSIQGFEYQSPDREKTSFWYHFLLRRQTHRLRG